MGNRTASKVERHRARQAARADQAVVARGRRRRRIRAVGVAVVIAATVVGVLVAGRYLQARELAALQAGADRVAAEIGCRTIEQDQPNPSSHIPGRESDLAAEPPEVLYPQHPPLSGRHVAQAVPSGAFDVAIDPRLTTHNLAHGYVVVWVDDGAARADVEALHDWVRRNLPTRRKLLVARSHAQLPEDANLAFTAWGAGRLCNGYADEVMEAFVAEHHDAGSVPEPGVAAHRPGDRGVFVPDDHDVFLPPLDERFDSPSLLE